MYEQPSCQILTMPKSAHLFQTCFWSHVKVAYSPDPFLMEVSAVKLLA